MDGSNKHQKEKVAAGRSYSEKTKASHHTNYPKKQDTQSKRTRDIKTVRDNRNVDVLSMRRKNYRNDDDGRAQSNDRRNSTKSEQNQTGSSRDSDAENENSRRHHHHKKRLHKDDDESFEELSRRKKMIESELNALDEEEAAASEQPRRKKRPSSSRCHSDHHSSRQQQAELSEHVKQEVLSDNESDSRHRRQKRTSRARRQNDMESGPNNHQWGRPEHTTKPQKSEKDKVKPNFETSGKLAEDTNTFNGVVIKYNEPVEARKPRRKWRLYPFKGETSLPFIPVHRQSAYLLGRSRLIADIPIDHPSCSKQHAVLQFRFLPYEREDGTTGKSVRPYVIDLDSSNGTYVNNNRVDPRRYVELFEKDVLKFGFSTRVYVLLHEDSKNEGDDAGS